MKKFLLFLLIISAISLNSCSSSKIISCSYFEKIILENKIDNYELVDDYTIRDKDNQDLYVFSYPIVSKFTNQLINPVFSLNEDKSSYKATLYNCAVTIPKKISKEPIQFNTVSHSFIITIHDKTSKEARKRIITNIFGEQIEAISYSGAFDKSSEILIYPGNNGIQMEICILNNSYKKME